MPLLFILAVLVLGWFGWKTLKRELARLQREQRSALRPPEKLERDSETGRYRPRPKG